jgi:hypothetical protein
MISISLLSLPTETLQRMATHEARSETSCRRSERIIVLGFVLIVSAAAVVAALIVG